MKKPVLLKKITRGLAIATQVIITAPVKLPVKLVKGAQLLSLFLGIIKKRNDEEEPQDG